LPELAEGELSSRFYACSPADQLAQKITQHPSGRAAYFSDSISITKRYFTSLFSSRSYASLIF
jgi:hypothetical protein